MAVITPSRTTIYLTASDKLKIQQIKEKENLNSVAAVLRWAINEVLK